MMKYLLLLLALCCFSNADLVVPSESEYTFKFAQSVSGFSVWTAPATRRIKDSDTTVPTASGSILPVSSAMEELESFQLIIAPTSSYSSFKFSMTGFPNLGPNAWVDVGAAEFSDVSPWAQTGGKVTDYTDVVSNGDSVSLSSSLPTVLWITVYVPGNETIPGSTTATITLTPNGAGAISIPVELYVFNFTLDITPNFATYMSSQPTFDASYTLEERDPWKKTYLQHRMSSPGEDWPNGFSWKVGWDCDSESLVDSDGSTSTQSCTWANGCTMERYIQGKGAFWRGVEYSAPEGFGDGFPIYGPVRTDNARPDPFCGVSCDDNTYGGWMCSDAYEQKWGLYLATLNAYLLAANVTSKTKGFWYTQNEPQNWNDYTVSAYLCSVARKYAPGMPIMLSREANPQIAEREEYDNCSYDIWLPYVWRYTPSYTRLHQALYDETSWFYSLDTDGFCTSPGNCGPAFQPTLSQSGDNSAEDPVATNDGPHYRVIPWVAWSNRITGWGYYHDDIFWDQRDGTANYVRPRISAALLREGFEDYEYLYIANGNRHPDVFVKEDPDNTAMSVGYAVGSWINDPTAIHKIRHELGLKIEGTRADYPYLQEPANRLYGNYYIDFRDTSAGPIADFDYDGHTWMAIGWEPYNITAGYGWNSQYMGLLEGPGSPILASHDVGAADTVESTILYDDYNAPDEFHFALQQGVYNVTVGIGWMDKCYGDPEFISINNVVFRNDTCDGNTCCSVREYSAIVNVYPGANGAGLIVSVNVHNGYTFLSYMKMEATGTALPPVHSTGGSTGSSTTGQSSANTSAASSMNASLFVAFLFAILLILA